MNRSILQSMLLGLALLLPISGAVQAEDAASLDELLTLIKNARLSESSEQSEREAAFRRARTERAELLKQARAELAAE